MPEKSRIALGTAQLGSHYGVANKIGRLDSFEFNDLLDLARANGIDLLDTAMAYGCSESVLGEAGVDDFRVVSKLPTLPAGCKEVSLWVQKSISASLDALRIESLDGLLIHNAGDMLRQGSRLFSEVLEALYVAKDEGLIKKVGVSVYAPAEVWTISKLFAPDLLQAPLNLVDRRFVSSGCFSRMSDEGAEIHTRSCFLQGLLLMDVLPQYFSPWRELWMRWRAYLGAANVSPVAVCLAYSLHQQNVQKVIVGVDSVAQLSEILREANNLNPLPSLPEISSYDERLVNPSNWSIA